MIADTTDTLKAELCRAMCANVSLCERDDGNVFVSTPFSFPDGDAFSIYLKRLPSGGFRLSDMGATLMHLSYEFDIDKLRDGSRQKVFAQIISEMGVEEEGGEFFLEIPAAHLGDGVFRFGQALTRVHDITFLNRVQVESTFYEDLSARLSEIVGEGRLIRDYMADGVPQAENYRADFGVESTVAPLLIFGVPSQTKARLATLIITYLQKHDFRFRSLVVYSDMTMIPRIDVARLTSAANDQVSSINEADALSRKLRAAVNL